MSARRPPLTPLLVLRSAAFMAWLVLTVIVAACVILLASPFVHGRTLYPLGRAWTRLATWGARVICGIQVRLRGVEHLPDGPVILLVKHQSAWETLALPALLDLPLSFVFKRELLFVPFFGWALGRFDMIRVDRSRGPEAAARVATQGRRLLDQGYAVILFPEGTRTARGSTGKYKYGGARLAVQTGTPVVPIALTSGRCWPRQAFIKYPGLVEVSIGAPMASVGREPAELMAAVEAWIEAEMRRLDPEAYAG